MAHQGFPQVSAKASAQDNYGIIACVRACVCACVYVFILPEHSLLPFIPLTFPLCTVSEASGAICQFCVCVSVCVCASWTSEGESILCKLERERGKKAEGGSGRAEEGGEVEWKCVCVCVCVCDCSAVQCVFVCLSFCPRAAKSAINLTPSWQRDCVVV